MMMNAGEEFPFDFLRAFGNKATTIKRLRSGTSNGSDLGGVLQRSNIHIKVCDQGGVTATLAALEASAATARAKARFGLATDGVEFQAEDLTSSEVVACDYADFPEHFGFFLPLAFLAEDTDIFNGQGLLTGTVERMSSGDGSNTHEVVAEVFRAMNVRSDARRNADMPRWAEAFPYENGGLFSDSTDVPRFSRIARSYLVHIGGLDWQKINPDIFGSMIRAVTEDEERGALGMHYTSVPNILKVLNPLFLDDLRARLEEAGSNSRKLPNLRNRIARIRVFDPACGSGNFLVIAYKEMRKIESETNGRRNETGRRSRRLRPGDRHHLRAAQPRGHTVRRREPRTGAQDRRHGVEGGVADRGRTPRPDLPDGGRRGRSQLPATTPGRRLW